jgi:hypothetical protein
MPKNSTYATNLLALVFQNANYAGIGDVSGLRGSGTPGDLYISLHTGVVGAGDNQHTNEAAYTGYARVAVPRSIVGWTVSGAVASNAAAVVFPICTGGSSTVIYFGIGTDATGNGNLLYAFPLVPAMYEFCGANGATYVTVSGGTWQVGNSFQVVASAGGTLPTGLAAGTTYTISAISGNDLTITGVTLSSAGFGLMGLIGSIAITSGMTVEFFTGQLTVNEI